MDKLWRRYQDYGRAKLTTLGPFHGAQIPFYGGVQFADLLLGSTLVEIKAVTVDPGDVVHRALDQVVGYTLCDRADEYSIDHVAIYLAWQSAVLTVAIDDLLVQAGAEPAEWPGWKEAFWDYSAQARADHADQARAKGGTRDWWTHSSKS